MKARTKTERGEIFFCYEDYYGNRFSTWHDLCRHGQGTSYLVGYFRSYYAGCEERIDEMFLPGRPRVEDVRKFIEGCKKVITEE